LEAPPGAERVRGEMTAQLDDALLQARAGVPWRTLIYTSHFASAWGERMWEFSAGILLLGLGGGRSLQLTATFAFALQLTQMLLGAKVGGLVDRGNPQTTPVAALAGQSFGIALAALSAASALHLAADGDVNVPFSAGLIIAFSCVAKLSSLASKISVENHWAVALAAGEAGPQVLTKLTSNMRAIDLSCKMMAPIVAGLIMSAFSPAIAGLAVALANALAWPVEVICLLSVYRDPWCRSQLEARYHKGDAQAPSKSNSAPTLEENAWKLYFSQRIWPSAFALSMLHLTVLSFGQLMTAYVLTLGVDVAIVSLYRSLGEVFGFAATQMKPWLDKHQGLSHAHVATIFIWFQLAMLVPSAVGASFWARC